MISCLPYSSRMERKKLWSFIDCLFHRARAPFRALQYPSRIRCLARADLRKQPLLIIEHERLQLAKRLAPVRCQPQHISAPVGAGLHTRDPAPILERLDRTTDRRFVRACRGHNGLSGVIAGRQCRKNAPLRNVDVKAFDIELREPFGHFGCQAVEAKGQETIEFEAGHGSILTGDGCICNYLAGSFICNYRRPDAKRDPQGLHAGLRQ